MNVEKFYTVREMCELLHQTPQTIRKWALKGKLQAYRPGKEFLFTESEVERFLNESRVGR